MNFRKILKSTATFVLCTNLLSGQFVANNVTQALPDKNFFECCAIHTENIPVLCTLVCFMYKLSCCYNDNADIIRNSVSKFNETFEKLSKLPENKSEETNNTPEKTEPSNNKTQTSTTEQKNPTTTSQPSSTGATNKPSTSGGSSSSSASVTVPKQEDTVGNLVWVPVNGGTKYHKTSGCSNMKNPMQVTVEHAKSNGYTACKKCY